MRDSERFIRKHAARRRRPQRPDGIKLRRAMVIAAAATLGAAAAYDVALASDIALRMFALLMGGASVTLLFNVRRVRTASRNAEAPLMARPLTRLETVSAAGPST
jgi:hypothetical protein